MEKACGYMLEAGKPMNEVISLIVLEHGFNAVINLSVVCPILIPGFGGGK